MLAEFLVMAYAAACGFVAAGILGSFYQLVTDRPARFAVSMDTTWTGMRDVLIIAFCGPFMLMRNALRARVIERRPVGWLVASTTIAFVWSVCSGIVVLHFGLATMGSL